MKSEMFNELLESVREGAQFCADKRRLHDSFRPGPLE
jgi:hypothetical protein